MGPPGPDPGARASAPHGHGARRLLAGILLLAAAGGFLGYSGALGPALRTPATGIVLYLAGSAGTMLLADLAGRRWFAGPLLAWTSLAGLALRIGLACTAPLNFDLRSYAIVVDALRRGEIVYEATWRYNYGPIWFGILDLADSASRRLRLDPHVGFLLTTILGDACLAAALYAASRSRGARRARLVALAWWVNPVAIATSSIHGQFDNLSIAIFVGALALGSRSTTAPSKASALVAGLGIAVKQVSLVFAGAFLGLARAVRPALRNALLVPLPFVLLLLPYYLMSPRNVEAHVLRYRSFTGSWGWVFLLGVAGIEVARWVTAIASYAALLLSSAAGFLSSRRHGDGLVAGRLSALVFLCLTTGWSVQMLQWPLAFGPRRTERRWALAYTVAGAAAYTGFLAGGTNDAAFVVVWLVALGWTAHLMRRTLRPPAASVV